MSDSKTAKPSDLNNQITLEFDDNHLLALLCGEHDAHLARIEHQLGLQIASRGNRLALIGPEESVETARTALETIWQRLKHGLEVGPAEIDAVLRSAMGNLDETARAAALRAIGAGTPVVERGGKPGRGHSNAAGLMPRSPTQARYLQAMADSALVFGVGPAGTGKTYLAVAEAVRRFLAEEVDRIIITRPAVEAGERLGFLPGDMRDKVDPYLRPIYDALFDLLGPERTAKRLESGQIEVAPLAFMRGRTLANAFVILDEAQNTTTMQMRMVLTRLGENSRMVVTGDPSQIDLPPNVRSGLLEALDILGEEEDMDIVRFAAEDVVRHALVARIVRAYARADKTKKQPE
ncbi:MAG: PhoH family protein [Alphaproteobacteria bacterium]|nr:PhoH family protein [Alphaproteobacteria bacterium SS10]